MLASWRAKGDGEVEGLKELYRENGGVSDRVNNLIIKNRGQVADCSLFT